MTANARRRPSSPEATPLDNDDLLSEVLLRLPPQPSSLPRASAVCKRWLSLVSDAGFLRRFRLRHRRNPPLLGFFDTNKGLTFEPTLDAPNRVPLGGFSRQRDHDDRFIPLGCRHGLVLIWYRRRKQVLVWDPVTGDHHRIAVPAPFNAKYIHISGAVLRGAAGDDRHFQVVLVVGGGRKELPRRVLGRVYSSDTGVWGNLISTPISPCSSRKTTNICKAYIAMLSMHVLSDVPAVLVGDSLYWTLVGDYAGILEFDLERQTLAVIQVPVGLYGGPKDLTVMRAEGGGLGFLFVSRSDSNAQLWKLNTDCDGAASWVMGRTIEIYKLLSLKPSVLGEGPEILGFAEYNNMVLLSTRTGPFMVQLESLQFKELSQAKTWYGPHPFESVYTAETDIVAGHDVAEL